MSDSGENKAVLRGLSDEEVQQRIVVLSSARDRTTGGLRDQIHDALVEAAEVRDERRRLYDEMAVAANPFKTISLGEVPDDDDEVGYDDPE